MDLEQRIAKLEKRISEEKCWKDEYNKLSETHKTFIENTKEQRDRLERFETLSKLLSELVHFGQVVPTESAQTQASSINLEHTETVVNVTHKEAKPIELSTRNQVGKIMYVILHDLASETEGVTEDQISDALLEHGWTIPSNSVQFNIRVNLKKKGLLVQIPESDPTRYRLPSKVKLNVAKEV